MKKYTHRLTLALLSSALMFSVSQAQATTLNDVFQVAAQMNTSAKRSQAKIDGLTEETRQLLSEYKTVLKEVEGLRVYNRQLEKQIGNQEQEMAQLTVSIDEVTVIERQITPLMLRMIDGLEQFVELDAPFLIDERRERIEVLRETMDRADVLVSEKFSQVFRAFQIENDYGRTMETYSSSIELGGVERNVDILKVGRIALVYQTPDGEETGVYNVQSRAFEPVDASFNSSVRQGIRMARQQASIEMLSLPIAGAGAGAVQ